MNLFSFFLLIFFAISCQQDPYSELKEDLKELLDQGKANDAIALIEISPYESIRDPEVAYLSAKAYSEESLLDDTLFEAIFNQDPRKVKISFSSLSENLKPYTFHELYSLKQSLSAFFRSRHNQEGFAEVEFDEAMIENFLREAHLRFSYLVSQLIEYIELCEITPYFFGDYSESAYPSLFSNAVDDTKTTYEDLMAQTGMFDEAILEEIENTLNNKTFYIQARGQSYSFSWSNNFGESLYKLAQNLKKKKINSEKLNYDIDGLSSIIQDLSTSQEMISYLPETEIASHLKKGKLSKKKEILSDSLNLITKKIEALKKKERSKLLKKIELLRKIMETW